MAMKVTILAVGKIKEKFFRDAIDEYAKRLGRYCKFEIIEVADEKTPDSASEAQEDQIKLKEAERIISKINPDAYVITLEILGKEMNSVSFSDMLGQLGVEGKSQVIFVIGGSFAYTFM